MHVITTLDRGGAEAMLVRLLQRMDQKYFQSSVVSLTTRGLLGNIVEATGTPVTSIGMTGLTSVPSSIFRLCQAIKTYKPDIVHTWLYHSDLMGFISARLVSDASVIWNIRCATLEPGDVSSSTRGMIWFLKKLSSYPEIILFNSVAGQQAHQSIGYDQQNCLVVPNGFDLEVWCPNVQRRSDFRAEIGVESNTFLVGMIARYHQIKDQSTFLAAAARLKDIDSTFRFVLVGLEIAWNNKSLVAEIEKYDLREKVILLGPRSDMSRIMAGLDCLMSTSTSEGFPNVIGEAMACGVPCVATDVGDTRRIIGDTGIIVDIGNVNGLINGVTEIMSASTDEKKRRSVSCRKRIKEHYELSHVTNCYADIYRELGEKSK